MSFVFLSILFSILNLNSARIIVPSYIDNLSDSEFSIGYETDINSYGWVGWGDFPKCDRYITPTSIKKNQKINLYGIKSGKKYCYTVFLPLDNSTYSYVASSGVFLSLYDDTVSSYSFIVTGNTVFNTEDENLKLSSASFSLIYEEPLFLIHTGNILKYENDINTPFYGIENIVKSKPIFSVPGPKEYGEKKEKGEGYKFLQKNYSPYRAFSRNGAVPHYYYIDVSESRFIFLDDNNLNDIKDAPSIKRGTKQWLWLENTLKYSKDKKWIFVVTNHPLYPSYAWDEADRNSLEELFIKYKVDIVFQNGGDFFLRTKKLKYGQYDENGVYYMTIGGANIYQTYPIEDEISDIKLNIKGFLYIKVNNLNIDMIYYDYMFNQLDRFVYSK